MMIHAALRWPDVSEKDLWPMALAHSAYFYNNIPQMGSGLSPEEIWTGSTFLDPRLKDGHKIPK